MTGIRISRDRGAARRVNLDDLIGRLERSAGSARRTPASIDDFRRSGPRSGPTSAGSGPRVPPAGGRLARARTERRWDRGAARQRQQMRPRSRRRSPRSRRPSSVRQELIARQAARRARGGADGRGTGARMRQIAAPSVAARRGDARGSGRRRSAVEVRRRGRDAMQYLGVALRLGGREPGGLRLLGPDHVRLRADRRLAAAPRRLPVRDGRRGLARRSSSPAISSSSTGSATRASTSAAASSSMLRTQATSSRSRASRTRGTRRPGSAHAASSRRLTVLVRYPLWVSCPTRRTPPSRTRPPH